MGQARVRVLCAGGSRRAAARAMHGSSLNVANTDPRQPREQPGLGEYKTCLHMGCALV